MKAREVIAMRNQVIVEDQLAEQLCNPKHCYIKLGGVLLTHKPLNPKERTAQMPEFSGPIRFTLMAATRMIAELKLTNAKIIPA